MYNSNGQKIILSVALIIFLYMLGLYRRRHESSLTISCSLENDELTRLFFSDFISDDFLLQKMLFPTLIKQNTHNLSSVPLFLNMQIFLLLN